MVLPLAFTEGRGPLNKMPRADLTGTRHQIFEMEVLYALFLRRYLRLIRTPNPATIKPIVAGSGTPPSLVIT